MYFIKDMLANEVQIVFCLIPIANSKAKSGITIAMTLCAYSSLTFLIVLSISNNPKAVIANTQQSFKNEGFTVSFTALIERNPINHWHMASLNNIASNDKIIAQRQRFVYFGMMNIRYAGL